MKTISERIKEGLELRGMNQIDLVRNTGITKGAISSYISGSYVPKQKNIYKIAKALNVSEAWLIGSDVPLTRNQKVNASETLYAVQIPILGRVAAGIPIEEIEDIIGYEEISNKVAETAEHFALKIEGDSMEPQIHDGDIVIVRKQPDANSGDIVIAAVNGEDGTCKKLKKTDSGILLLPFNGNYDPLAFSSKEVKEKPIQIIGKVIESRSKF